MSEAKGTVLIITEYVNAFTFNAYTYIFSNGNSYFTDRSDRVPITLPTREGYTRTWAATKTFERPPLSDGTDFYNDITGTTYNVYISRANVAGITVYVNTDWVFLSSDTIKQYTLAYTGGGTLSGGTGAGNHNYGATIDLPTTNTKTGYTFSHFTNNNGDRISGDSFSLPASDTTVTAHWTINRYTVTYLSIPDHFDFTSTPTLYDYNTLLRHTTIDIPTPRVIGEVYSFEKWTYGGSDLGESKLPTENINLVANWNSTDKDEIQMSELSSVFDPSSSFQNIKISNYFARLKLNDSSQRENVDFFNKLKGRGTF